MIRVVETSAPLAIEGVDLDSRIGLYFNEQTNEPMRLVIDGGRLHIAGGPGLITETSDLIRRMGTNIWFRSQDESRLVSF